MSSLHFFENQLTFVDGDLGFHEDCCCVEVLEPVECVYCLNLAPAQYEVEISGFTDGECDTGCEEWNGVHVITHPHTPCVGATPVCGWGNDEFIDFSGCLPVDFNTTRYGIISLDVSPGIISGWDVTVTLYAINSDECFGDICPSHLYRKHYPAPGGKPDCESFSDLELPYLATLKIDDDCLADCDGYAAAVVKVTAI